MGTDVERTRSVGARGSRIRVRLVGEALEPSSTRGVGTPSMCDQMRSHAAVGELYQVESSCTRGKREVRDPDEVSVGDAFVMSLQSIERTPKQAGRYLAVDSFCFPASSPCSCRPRSQAGKSEPDEKATGNGQGVKPYTGKRSWTCNIRRSSRVYHPRDDSCFFAATECYGATGSGAS